MHSTRRPSHHASPRLTGSALYRGRAVVLLDRLPWEELHATEGEVSIVSAGQARPLSDEHACYVRVRDCPVSRVILLGLTSGPSRQLVLRFPAEEEVDLSGTVFRGNETIAIPLQGKRPRGLVPIRIDDQTFCELVLSKMDGTDPVMGNVDVWGIHLEFELAQTDSAAEPALASA